MVDAMMILDLVSHAMAAAAETVATAVPSEPAAQGVRAIVDNWWLWIVGSGLTMGLAAAAAPIKRAVTSMVAVRTARALQRALHPDTADPALAALVREWVLATSKLAEYLIPDRGAGAHRKTFVKTLVAKAFPGAAGGAGAEQAGELIDEVVSSFDEQLKAVQPPTEPPK
mgnify:CR=1 FL=1